MKPSLLRVLSFTMAVSGLLAARSVGQCADFGPDQPYDKLSRALVTPHTPFANPLAGGPIKVLVIAPTGTQRETIELAQRLEIDFAALMTEGFDSFGPYDRGYNRETYLEIEPAQFRQVVDKRLAEDAEYDVIIIGKMPWSAFPAAVQTRIMDKVKSGAGLVYINPTALSDELKGALANNDASSIIARGVPISSVPALTGVTIHQGQLGKGQVVTVTYPGDLDPKNPEIKGMLECLTPGAAPDDLLHYDYCQALVARACIAAANRQPQTLIANVVLLSTAIDRAQLTSAKVTVSLTGPLTNCELEYAVRDRQGRQEASRTLKVAGNSATLPPPLMKSGEKMLNLSLKSGGKIVDWYSVPFSVVAPVSIQQVELVKDTLPKGEAISGRIVLSQSLGAGRSLRVDAVDNHGRLVATAGLTVAGTEGRFALPIPRPLTKAHRLVATLSEKSGVIDQREVPFYINTTDPTKVDDFSFFAWGGAKGASRSAVTFLNQFARSGIDTLYNTSSLWDTVEQTREIGQRACRANLQVAPYATRLFLVSSGYEHTKSVAGPDGPCIRNCTLSVTPEERAQESGIVHMKDLASALGPLGPAYYSLGDENALAWPGEEVCFCDECRESFQKYVKGIYGTLDALNKEWGSDYKDWTEIKRISLPDAWKQKRYPQWVDHRMHMDKLFADLHADYAKAIQAVDPVARVGMEGPVYPSHSYTGFDLYEMLKTFKYFNPYNHLPEVKTICFLPKDSITGIWFGSYVANTSEGLVRYTPWHCLFEGMTAVGWWTVGGGNRGLGGPAAYAPDYSPLSFFQWACDEVAEIKSGIGKLLVSSERTIHPIAVYYSNACRHASTISFKESTWEKSLQDFHYVLRDGGFEYRYLPPEEVQKGGLDRYRVLLLPYAQAVSDDDVNRIREFVRKGGLLIADFSPALMDEHGKRRDQSALTDVFGKFERMNINAFGKGKAVYLGDYAKGYADKREAGEGKGIAAGVSHLLSELAGVRPFAEVTDASSQLRPDIEVSQFTNGDATYLCLLRGVAAAKSTAAGAEGAIVTGVDSSGSSEILVKLPAAAHVYDVREGKYLGKASELKITLQPSQAKVLACLPVKPERLTLKLNSASHTQGTQVPVTATVSPSPGKRTGLAVRFDVFGPDGKLLPHYTQKVVFSTGTFRATIPLSLNEQPGSYRVTATEIATGVAANASFRVSGK